MANNIGWGQGSENNNIGWGQGAINNNISWGYSYNNSYSGETDIIGNIEILDKLSVSSAAAYSLRKLREIYTGNCIRVRRSSDNTEQNIGFLNGQLDTISLLSFVGNSSGFVTTWYDQSGNGRNAIQTSYILQPRIMNNGVLDTKNGKPTIRFTGGKILNTANFPCGVSRFTANSVACNENITNLGNYNRILSVASSTDSNDFSTNSSIAAILNINSNSIIGSYRALNPRALQNLLSGRLGSISTWYDSTNSNVSINGLTPSTTPFAEQPLGANVAIYLGGEKSGSVSSDLIGSISEAVWFHSSLPTLERQLLENNQINRYSIT